MKLLLGIFIAAVFLCSCESNTKPVAASSANEQLVKQYFDHFNKHQWKEMASLYADTAYFKDPSLGPGMVMQTRQQIIDKYTELGTSLSGVRDSITGIYPSGSRHIVVEFVSTGTAPDQSRFSLPVCTIFTIENGKISGDFTYYDNFE